MSSRINYQHWGLAPNPWARYLAPTGDGERVRAILSGVAREGALVTVTGPRGAGKTVAVREGLNGVAVVEPLRLTRDKMLMGDIETAFIVELSDESPRRSGEARSRQTIRIVGSHHSPVVLWIDDAHVLHAQTVIAIKRLREASFAGRSPILGVVLSAQRDPAHRAPEVRLRSDYLELSGLSEAEIIGVLGKLFGDRIEPLAREAIAHQPEARWWLDLRSILETAMARAIEAGRSAIDLRDVAVTGDIQTRLKVLGIRQADLAHELQVSRQEVSGAIGGDPSRTNTRQRIDTYLDERLRGADQGSSRVA